MSSRAFLQVRTSFRRQGALTLSRRDSNGDTPRYTFVEPPNNTTTLTFKDGTGKFTGVTGSATAYGSNLKTVQQGSLLILSNDTTTVGTINY